MEMVVRQATTLAGAEHCGAVAEIHLQSFVEDIERAFPQTFVLECFSVANNSTIDLVHLIESAVLHDERQDFAANAAGAVGDDWSVLEVVVLATFEFCHEIRSLADVGYDCVLESTYTGFELVAAVEEDDIVTSLLDECMHFGRSEMRPPADDSVRIKNNLVGHAKRDNFIPHAH